MSWRTLTPADAPSARALLTRHPLQGVWLLGALESAAAQGLSYAPGDLYGLWGDEGLSALIATPSGLDLFVPAPADFDAVAAFVREHLPRAQRLSGPSPIVDYIVSQLGESLLPLQHDTRSYVMMREADADLPPVAGFRVADVTDLEGVTERDMAFLAEAGRPVASENLRDQYQRTAMRLLEQRFLVLDVAGETVYQTCFGAQTADFVELSNVYVPPAHRRRGHALTGTAAACRLAAQRAPRVMLTVEVANNPAQGVYNSLGFTREPWQLRELRW